MGRFRKQSKSLADQSPASSIQLFETTVRESVSQFAQVSRPWFLGGIATPLCQHLDRTFPVPAI